MKTSDLISAIAQDRSLSPPPARALGIALAIGAAIAALLFFSVTGRRADLAAVALSPRFLFKVLLQLALLAAAGGVVLRLSRPGGRSGPWTYALCGVGCALLLGGIAELVVLPRDAWLRQTLGHNASWCLRIIPLLSVAPLIASFVALRRAAPTRPVLAGAAAGLLSAAVAASLYALHCTDDSPLFVAAWYGLAILLVTAVGAVLGPRLLRW